MYKDLIPSSAFIVMITALVVGTLVISLPSTATWAAGSDPTLGMKITSGSTCTSNCIIIGPPGPQGPPGPRGPQGVRANKAQQDLRVHQVRKVLRAILALKGLKD